MISGETGIDFSCGLRFKRVFKLCYSILTCLEKQARKKKACLCWDSISQSGFLNSVWGYAL